MRYDRITRGSLDYCLYRYGKSKTLFRGPRPDFKRRYCAFLGSSESFGKFVPHPFTQHLQRALELPCANFAAVNAGVEMYLKDPSVLLATADARVSVIAVTGAHNLSNRFYTVHPRRNDRFVRPSKMLQTLYRDVDFTDIHYTRHLLVTLFQADPVRFGIIVDELKSAWVARMTSLLEMVDGRTVLLWMSERPPMDATHHYETADFGPDPLFVDQAMIDTLSPLVTRVVECVASDAARQAGTDGMQFCDSDVTAAQAMPGPQFHQEVAAALGPVLRDML